MEDQIMEDQIYQNYRQTKRLAIVELVLSCLILLFVIVSDFLGPSWSISSPLARMSVRNIWPPVIGIITGGIGLGALKYGNYDRICLLMSYSVMCIISAITSGILIICTRAWLGELIQYNDDDDDPNCTYYWCIRHKALLAFEVLTLIGTVVHFIASIVSTTLICRFWYLKRNTRQHRINSSQLGLVRKLGQGQFGIVWQGRYTDPSWQTMDVAFKISNHHLKRNSSSGLNLISANCFFQEIVALDVLRHPNIIGALGICSNLKMAGGITTPALVLEYMDGGNSAEYVLSEREHLLTSDLMRIFIDICKAGEHLQKMGVIHRDIGARNVLIRKHPRNGKPAVAKLTDFGLAKDVGKGAGIYKFTNADRAMFHKRYTSPEGFRGEFSSQSDIWSFGVFMWEVYMLMDINQTEPVAPYSDISSQDIQRELCDGYRLGQPLKASNDMYSTMTACWTWAPESRPTFAQLHKTLKAKMTNNGIEQAIELTPKSAGDMVQLAILVSGGGDLVVATSSEHPIAIKSPYGRPT